MSDGWYVSHEGRVAGPFTWERALEMAGEGWIGVGDLVCRPGSDRWVPVTEVPAFVSATGTVEPQFVATGVPPVPSRAQVPSSEVATDTAVLAPESLSVVGNMMEAVPDDEAAPNATAATPRKRSRLALKVASGLALGSLFACAVFWFVPGIPVARAEFKAPSAADIIETEAYGRVPVNRVGVMLEDGRTASDARRVAEAMDGTIVGELPDVGLYLIETPGSTEAELAAALQAAAAADGVEVAFPDQAAVAADRTFVGIPCNLFGGPAYANGSDAPFRMIGAQEAAEIIESSGLDLKPVEVSVIDDGLYMSTEVGGEVRWSSDNDAVRDMPLVLTGGGEGPIGIHNHGTAVAGIIGADATNGGITGIASVLGSNLSLNSKNVEGPIYGLDEPAAANAEDITVGEWTAQGDTFSFGGLCALRDAVVVDHARVVNCSWGSVEADGDPGISAAYRRFFEYMLEKHPDVVFVCAAGNENAVPTNYWPGGIPLPNVITVGNVGVDGTPGRDTNVAGGDFEVTLFAPGDDIVCDVAEDGSTAISWSGTSFAAPQVASAAAMMLAADPSLTAAEIKDILKSTAVLTPSGIPCLAVDEAVRKVVNDVRAERGLPPLEAPAAHPDLAHDEPPSGSTRIVLRAVSPTTDDAAAVPPSTITAEIDAVGDSGAEIEAFVIGPGALEGPSPLVSTVTDATTLTWQATPASGSMVVHVTRSDSGACWRVRFGPDVEDEPEEDPTEEPDLADELEGRARLWNAPDFAEWMASDPFAEEVAAQNENPLFAAVESLVEWLSDPWRPTPIPDIRGTWVSTVPGKGYEMSYHVDGFGSYSESADVVMKIDVQEGAVARGEMHVDNYTFNDDPYEYSVGSVSPGGIPPVPPPQRVADPVHWPEGPIFPITATISGDTVKITPAGIGNGTYDNGATCMTHEQLFLLGRLDGEVFSGTTVLVVGPSYPQDIGVGTWPWWSGGEDWDSLIPADSGVESTFSVTREK